MQDNGDVHGQAEPINDAVEALAALDEEGWGETEEKSFTEVPDGRYQIKIDSVVVEHAKSSGRLQVAWAATIVAGGDGSHNNRKLFWRDGIESAENRSWFRGRLARIGLEWPASAKQLPETLQEAVGTFAEVTVKTKDEFVNVYFNKAIDQGDVTDPPEASAAGAAESVDNDATDEQEITVGFTDDDLTKGQEKEIDAQAKRLGFDPAEYTTKCDMMMDMGEYVDAEIRNYESCLELLDVIKKAKAPAAAK